MFFSDNLNDLSFVYIIERAFMNRGTSAFAVCCNAGYQQTLLKLLRLISTNAPAGNCCMLIVIILHPALDFFDLCAKCVFNKSARGDEKKESYKKILDER